VALRHSAWHGAAQRAIRIGSGIRRSHLRSPGRCRIDLRRFAARRSGLACGLALAVTPARTRGPGRGSPRGKSGLRVADLPRRVINVHGRQVFHLVPGEAEMDKESPDLSHGADRDSHFLAAPHVPRLEEHVGYLVAARVHE
jgi:hypothetical protein